MCARLCSVSRQHLIMRTLTLTPGNGCPIDCHLSNNKYGLLNGLKTMFDLMIISVSDWQTNGLTLDTRTDRNNLQRPYIINFNLFVKLLSASKIVRFEITQVIPLSLSGCPYPIQNFKIEFIFHLWQFSRVLRSDLHLHKFPTIKRIVHLRSARIAAGSLLGPGCWFISVRVMSSHGHRRSLLAPGR